MTQFDKNIKKRLDKFDSPYPSNMWEKIASELPEKKKRIIPVWMMVTVFVGILSIGMYKLYNLQNETLSDQDHVSIVPSKEHETLEGKEPKFDNLAEVDHSAIADKAIEEKQDLKSKDRSKSIQQVKDIKSIITSQSKNKARIKTTASSTQGDDLESTRPSNVQAQNFAEIESNDSNNQTESSTPSSTLTIDLKKSVNTNFAYALKDIMTRTSKPDAIQYQSDLNSGNADQIKSENIVVVEALGRTPFTMLPLAKGPLDAVSKKMAKMALECPTFINRPSMPGLTVYYSNDYAIKKMSNRSLNGDGDYLRRRLATEKSIYSYSAGLLFDVLKYNNAKVRAGVNYSQINEKFYFEKEGATEIKTVTVTDYIILDGQIVDSTINTETIETPGKLAITNYNKYKSVDIPLLLNYRVGQHRNFNFSVTGGALFNLVFTQEGRILERESNYPKTLGSNTDESPYKTNTGVALYGAFEINYRLFRGLDLIVAPSVKYNLADITKKQYSLNEKYMVIGLNTGVRLSL